MFNTRFLGGKKKPAKAAEPAKPPTPTGPPARPPTGPPLPVFPAALAKNDAGPAAPESPDPQEPAEPPAPADGPDRVLLMLQAEKERALQRKMIRDEQKDDPEGGSPTKDEQAKDAPRALLEEGNFSMPTRSVRFSHDHLSIAQVPYKEGAI